MAASALLATPAQLELVSQPLLLAAWCSDSKMELVAGAGGQGAAGAVTREPVLFTCCSPGAGHRWTLLCWRNESAGNTEAGGNYGTDAGTLAT